MPTRDTHPLTQAVLDQLRAEMHVHGDSQASLARDLEIDRVTLRRWLLGEREMPLPVFTRIVEHLDIPPDVFMTRARDRLPKPLRES